MKSASGMSELDSLICDLILWIGQGPKPYADVMDAWRTSCPRLTVWEDAVDRGFVTRVFDSVSGPQVLVTEAGHTFAAQRVTRVSRSAGARQTA